MSEELTFSNEDEALQHLADLTGKSIKIAASKPDKQRVKQFIQSAHLSSNPELFNYFFENISNFEDEGDAESWSMSITSKLPKKLGDNTIESETNLVDMVSESGYYGGPGQAFDKGLNMRMIKETDDEWEFELSSSGGLDV